MSFTKHFSTSLGIGLTVLSSHTLPAAAQSTASIPTRVRIFTVGEASMSSPGPFEIWAECLPQGTRGILLYDVDRDETPFGDHAISLQRHVRRVGIQFATIPETELGDCAQFRFDFKARIRSGVDAQLVPGATVTCRYVYQLPGTETHLRTAQTLDLRFTIEP